MRPRSTASVWLSKSGELIPEGRGGERGGRMDRWLRRWTDSRRDGQTALPGPQLSPVMLSTSTCHLCSSCSSCRISRFWRRSATVSSGETGRRELGRVGGACPLPGGSWASPHPFGLPRGERAALTVLQHLVPHIPAEEKRRDEMVPPHTPHSTPLSPPQPPQKPHFSLLSSSMSSASEKFSTWSPLGSGCTGRSRRGGSEGAGGRRGQGTRGTGGTGDPPSLTGLVVQQVVLLHELPVQLQGLGRPRGVEDIGVLVEQLLEGVERGLAGLWKGEGTHGTQDPCREPQTPDWSPHPAARSAPGWLLPIPPCSAAAPRLC